MPYAIAGSIFIGYLLGAIPFAYLIVRWRLGIDVRTRGSGNPGALAAWREAGPGWGLLALAMDSGKGVLAVYVARWFGLDLFWVAAAGFAAVAGHNWPIFLKFRGGKGGATTMGVLLAFMPLQFAIGLGVAVLVIIPTSNVRLGLIGLACIPLIAWYFDKEAIYIYYPLILVGFLTGYTLIGLRKELARGGGKRSGLIIDRNYRFWQTRKKD